MNTDLQAAFVKLEELVNAGRTSLPNGGAPAGTATLASLQRLGTTFDQVNSAGSKIIPAQTVCNYWNYWFQYLPEHFSGQTSFGLAERLIGPGTNGLSTPEEFPRNHLISGAGSQADGRYSDFYTPPPRDPPKQEPAGNFDPLHANANTAEDPPGPGDPADEVEQIIVHGSAYGPSGTESVPNCQAGQYGLPMGELLSPGQNRDSPNFGPYNVSQAAGVPAFGRTDLFLRQNGVREFWDSP